MSDLVVADLYLERLYSRQLSWSLEQVIDVGEEADRRSKQTGKTTNASVSGARLSKVIEEELSSKVLAVEIRR